MKRISSILCSILLLCMVNLCCGSASAAVTMPSNFDPNMECSVTLNVEILSFPPTPVADTEVTIYPVADFAVKDGEPVYTYHDSFKDCDVELEYMTIYDEDKVDAVYQYSVGKNLVGTKAVTNQNGRVRFEGLSAGIYLCVNTAAPNYASEFTPFLIATPSVAGSQWLYNVLANPKVEGIDNPPDPTVPEEPTNPEDPTNPENPTEPITPDTPTEPPAPTAPPDGPLTIDLTVIKKWNDDGKIRPQSVKVQLIKGTEVKDTVELSEANKWEYKWESLPYGEDYSVKEETVPDGYTVSYSGSKTEFIITNTSGKLIQTGQLKWPVPILAASGVIFIAIGVAVRGSGRKKKNET